MKRRVSAWDVEVFVVANALLIVALWLRHGGIDASQGPGGALTGIGQLTGLLSAYALLLQLVLMARVPPLERTFGFDRLARWHRWNGFAAVSLVLVHVVAITAGYAEAGSATFTEQFGKFVNQYADVLMAIVGTALLVVVALTSLQAVRARLSREAWYFVHLYAYLAVILGIAHQLAVGTDFVHDPAARAWWIAIYVVVAAVLLAWRVGVPLRFNARHHFEVASVHPEAPNVVSVQITGRDLDAIDARPGQFFLWRLLTRDRWYQAHPFSLSRAPDRDGFRITAKHLGDFTARLREVEPGTRVFAEGPYGTFTADRRTRRRVLLIAGGIGITPIRALLDNLRGDPGEIVLIHRVAHEDDIVFADEIDALTRAHGVVVHRIVDDVIGDHLTDRLGAPALAQLVPDIAQRDVFLCGPPAMVDAVHHRLRYLSVPRRQIHSEPFGY